MMTLCVLCGSCVGINVAPGVPDEPEISDISDVSSDVSEDVPDFSENDVIVIGEKNVANKFALVYNTSDSYAIAGVNMISEMIDSISNRPPVKLLDTSLSSNRKYQIIINSPKRSQCKSLINSLGTSEYAIKTHVTETETYIILAYNGYDAAMACFEKFTEQFVKVKNGVIYVDNNIDYREKCNANTVLIETGVEDFRDPFIFYENGMYYMYGTTWKCYYSESLTGPWTGPVKVTERPADAEKQRWAPEVYKYNGSYYMFTTYYSSTTGHRGCTILKADDPLGTFVEITNGHITPHDWDAIDGTLYIDDEGQPWMVFVHEWTSMSDGIGSFAVAKLSEDFTHFISEPVELFKARDTVWATEGITDGCFMYTCEDGSLLMLWSNFSSSGYVVAVARSESGNVLGPWTHEETLLYEKNSFREHDGGHGMIFTAADGNKYLCLHSPNTSTDAKKTCTLLVRVEEFFGKLRWNFYA